MENLIVARELLSITKMLLAQQSRKLLLLVHPDVAFETDNDAFIEDYYNKLDKELENFDYVITHLMFSPAAPSAVNYIKSRKELWDKFINLLSAKSDFMKLDKDYSVSFSSELPDYLIEHPQTKIWLGGGYQNLCVKETQDALESQLREVLADTGAEVMGLYKPLIITGRYDYQLLLSRNIH